MIRPDIDKTGVASKIVYSVWIGTWDHRFGKIVALNFLGVLGWKPLLAGIVVVSNEFFLLGVHRNYGVALLQVFLYRSIYMSELCVAIWMVCSLFRLAIALQTVV